jgi:hypothetical protein
MSTTKLTKQMAIDIMEATNRYSFESEPAEGRLIFWDNFDERDVEIWPHEGLDKLIEIITEDAYEGGKSVGRSYLETQIKDLLNIKS